MTQPSDNEKQEAVADTAPTADPKPTDPLEVTETGTTGGPEVEEARGAHLGTRLSAAGEQLQAQTKKRGKLAFGGLSRCWHYWQARGVRHQGDPVFAATPAVLRWRDFAAYVLGPVALLLVFADPVSVQWARELPPSLHGFFRWLTDFGTSGWVLVPTGVFCLIVLACNFNSAASAAQRAAQRLVGVAGYLFLSVGLSGLAVVALKWNIGRARPRHFDELGPVAFDPFAWQSSFTSFPSGHSTTAGALFVGLALLFPKARLALLLTGFWIAMSRVITGAHYPSDVAAGLILGGAFSFLLARAFARRGFAFKRQDKIWLQPRYDGEVLLSSIKRLLRSAKTALFS
ncbi:phosphatase PAP2 family protein [Polycladidibacter hongkongensis]|uniref:phosphatase PAP2 family protein n=1 Tax=Polycladidibacter hongkongensis TaxID=1647556 RepID=UPI00082CBF47|nr:phosphatase PAP2 family protein [Pseudovibrio hongkongensis]